MPKSLGVADDAAAEVMTARCGSTITRAVSGLIGSAIQLASAVRRPVDSMPWGGSIFGAGAFRIAGNPG